MYKIKIIILKYLILVFFPIEIISQNINGKVYDDSSAINGVKVYNVSNHISVYSDIEGDFIIEAKVNDTLLFESLFYESKEIVLKPFHFEDTAIFELNLAVNQLNEVILTNEKENRFSVNKHNNQTTYQISQDIKNNPHLYKPKESYSGGNLLGVLGVFYKLLKKKHKAKPKKIVFIDRKDLEKIISNDDFLNYELLNEQLKIRKEHTYLFLDYCEGKKLHESLLEKSNRIILLDSLVKFSKDFY
jgi:hypothetical protein